MPKRLKAKNHSRGSGPHNTAVGEVIFSGIDIFLEIVLF